MDSQQILPAGFGIILSQVTLDVAHGFFKKNICCLLLCQHVYALWTEHAFTWTENPDCTNANMVEMDNILVPLHQYAMRRATPDLRKSRSGHHFIWRCLQKMLSVSLISFFLALMSTPEAAMALRPFSPRAAARHTGEQTYHGSSNYNAPTALPVPI